MLSTLRLICCHRFTSLVLVVSPGVTNAHRNRTSPPLLLPPSAPPLELSIPRSDACDVTNSGRKLLTEESTTASLGSSPPWGVGEACLQLTTMPGQMRCLNGTCASVGPSKSRLEVNLTFWLTGVMMPLSRGVDRPLDSADVAALSAAPCCESTCICHSLDRTALACWVSRPGFLRHRLSSSAADRRRNLAPDSVGARRAESTGGLPDCSR